MGNDQTTSSLYGHKAEREAGNQLVARWEKDAVSKGTGHLYMSTTELQTYCHKRNHTYSELVRHCSLLEGSQINIRKSLGSEMGSISAPTKVIMIRTVGDNISDIITEIKHGT